MKIFYPLTVFSVLTALSVVPVGHAQEATQGTLAQSPYVAPVPPKALSQTPPDFNSGFHPSTTINQGSAKTTIQKNSTLSGKTYRSSGNNENALRITGATVTLSNVSIQKISGATSNTEDGDFYGLNAALLATDGAQVTITDSTVQSSADNGNGLFSYGKGTSLTAKNVKISTTADHSGGIQTTGGASTTAENLTIRTTGNSSAAIRSDRGGGTVRVNGGTYHTSGSGSPAIYSTADIAVTGAQLTATHSEGAVIEGKNKIALTDCTLDGSMDSTRVMGKNTFTEENVHGVMIYQSMSGDAEEGTSQFSMDGGTLISRKGDVFYVTNTDCTITLKNQVQIQQLDKTGVLLRVAGNSASRGWGKTGANGGTCTLTAENQALSGTISVDSISKLALKLDNGSSFTGSIEMPENAEGSRADSGVAVTLQKGAVWNLTADSVITSLTGEGKVNTQGHKLTVLEQ